MPSELTFCLWYYREGYHGKSDVMLTIVCPIPELLNIPCSCIIFNLLRDIKDLTKYTFTIL